MAGQAPECFDRLVFGQMAWVLGTPGGEGVALGCGTVFRLEA